MKRERGTINDEVGTRNDEPGNNRFVLTFIVHHSAFIVPTSTFIISSAGIRRAGRGIFK
jgi:hypothetical protein